MHLLLGKKITASLTGGTVPSVLVKAIISNELHMPSAVTSLITIR